MFRLEIPGIERGVNIHMKINDAYEPAAASAPIRASGVAKGGERQCFGQGWWGYES